jgi:2'-5' RNA ligase
VEPTQSALIVPVPEAEGAVGALRARYDTSASWGVPAHVTVLYPFLPPAGIDETVLAAVRETVLTVPRFDLVLTRTDWFGDDVLWLAPEPDGPFRALTAALWARFPQAAPYGGAFDDVVPHLTVAHGRPPPVLREAAVQVAAGLPIHAPVEAVRLIVGRPEPGDSWHTMAEFPLRPY